MLDGIVHTLNITDEIWEIKSKDEFINVIKDKQLKNKDLVYLVIGVIKNMKPEVTKNPKLLTTEDVIKILKIGQIRFEIAEKE